MHGLSLPEPAPETATTRPAFADPAAARVWLAAQPHTQPLALLAALAPQIAAVDAANLPPAATLELLDLLRHAARPALAALESRFLRKPLPLPASDQQVFTICAQLWTTLAIAYLRQTTRQAPEAAAPGLHRAASALRMAYFVHFQAAHDGPPQLSGLLCDILRRAEAQRITRQPLADPEFPQFGEDSIGGHLAWTLLLRQSDPYALSAAQLAVANRAFSRWRDLAVFQTSPEPEAKALRLDLATHLGEHLGEHLAAHPGEHRAASFPAGLPDGTPRWLDIRKIVRKLQQRIEALAAGESPEALKLGRELPASACLRLLRTLEKTLSAGKRVPAPAQPAAAPPAGKAATPPAQADTGTPAESGEIELVFGPENAFAAFRQEWLNGPEALDTRSARLAHQRLGIFGFDRVSQLPNAVRKISIPGEIWSFDAQGGIRRKSAAAGSRLLTPCLVAHRPASGPPRLGLLCGLRSDAQGTLSARLQWFTGTIAASSFTLEARRHPAFVLQDESPSLIAPASAALRPQQTLTLGESACVELLSILERGADFVRYALRP